MNPEDINENTEFLLPKAKVTQFVEYFLDNLYEGSPYVATLGPEPFIKAFDRLDLLKKSKISIENDEYIISEKTVYDLIETVVNEQIGNDLQQLVKMGMVEPVWNDSINDFTYRIKDNEDYKP